MDFTSSSVWMSARSLERWRRIWLLSLSPSWVSAAQSLSSQLPLLLYSSTVSDEQISGPHAERFEEAFVKLVKRQNQIIHLTYFFRQRYWFITMAHFVSASLVIGCSIFLLMTVGGIGLGTLLYIFYTAAALSQLFIFCYGGTLVAESVSSGEWKSLLT